METHEPSPDPSEESAASCGGAGPARFAFEPFIRRVFLACLIAEALLVLLDYVINYLHGVDDDSIRKIFNVAREESIPTWFATLQAAGVGLVLFLIYRVHRRSGERRRSRAGWLVLSGFFVFISMDDAAVIHERVGSAMGRFLEEGNPEDVPAWLKPLGELPSYNWQTYVMPLFAAVGVFLLVFVWKRMGRYDLRRYMILGLSVFVLAIGLDFLEGMDGLYDGWADRLKVREYTVSHYFKVTEETLEMVGTTLFLVGFLKYLARVSDGLRIEVRRAPGEAVDIDVS